MYMKSVSDLKNDIKAEIENSINSKLKTEILAIQLQETEFPLVLSLNVVFKNNNGNAQGILMWKNDCYELICPMKVNFTKKEDKK